MHQPMSISQILVAKLLAQFVQTHSGGKALLYKGYKYLKIPVGNCTLLSSDKFPLIILQLISWEVDLMGVDPVGS